MFKIIAIIAIATIAGLFCLSKIDVKTTSGGDTEDSSYVAGELVKVSISGEINHPGDYQIEATKTLGDLIDLAGGVTAEADPNSYISSLVIGERTDFYIACGVTLPEECVVETIDKVNINTANIDELMDIGFKSNQAENIVEYRKENGSFECLEEILDVSGIGDATFAKLKDLITLK